MKRKLIYVVGVSVIVVLLFVFLYPFSTNIERTEKAYVFENNSISETTVKINGEISGKLFGDKKTYIGEFAVAGNEELCQEGVQARIEWGRGSSYQSILFFYRGDFVSLGTKQIIIDSEMKNFAVEFDDGTIVATSKEMYEQIKSSGH